MEYLYILTLQVNRPGQPLLTTTSSGKAYWNDGRDRLAILQEVTNAVLDSLGLPHSFNQFSVMFFYLEPAKVGPIAELG